MNNHNSHGLRLLYLKDILEKQANESNALTRDEIIERLKEAGITVERKTFYSDVATLREYGVDIITSQSGRNVKYYLGCRVFELPELKLMVDAVQQSRFITAKKSKQLISKIGSLTNKYDENELERQVYVSDRIKSENETIYYSVDYIHKAINADRKIIFQYLEWYGTSKRLKHNGEIYVVSPWVMLWDNQNYYMIGFDDKSRDIRHYRVDKMTNISVSENKRDGEELFKNFDMEAYSARTFGMFGGESESVVIRCSNEVAGIIADRFGKEIKTKEISDEKLEIEIEVNVSPHFLGWILSLGNDLEIVGSEKVVKMMQDFINEKSAIYFKNTKK